MRNSDSDLTWARVESVTTSVAIGPRKSQRRVVSWRDVLSPEELANESQEWHLVTWYGATQCVDIRTRKTSLESVFLGSPPE